MQVNGGIVKSYMINDIFAPENADDAELRFYFFCSKKSVMIVVLHENIIQQNGVKEFQLHMTYRYIGI